MVHGPAVEHRRHAAPAVDAGADQDADLIQQPGIQECGVDGGAAHNGHALYAELRRQDLCGPGQIDPLLAHGDPGDAPAVQIGQVLPGRLLAGEDQQGLFRLSGVRPQESAVGIHNDFVAVGAGLFGAVFAHEAGKVGKKVLVIHPFTETIRSQYLRRELLFPGREVLPEFELITMKAVQSNGVLPEQFPYSDWFEALDFMCGKIREIDYDIALIGAGAYGMFLGAFCKHCGKQALHIGGALQLIFGIKGARWEKQYPPEFGQRLFNENWVNPLPSERPAGYEIVEDGCYW